MAGIYTWIKNIVCFMCILNLVLQILPGKNYQKYVHFFGGILLLIIVLNPLADLTRLSNGFEQVWRTESLKEEFGDLEIGMQGIEEMRTEKISEAYKAEIKRQIEEVVKAYGYTAKKTAITFDENTDGVMELKFINMEIARNIDEGEINVPKVRKNAALSEEIENMKNEIQEVYHILVQNINIIVQE